MTSSTTPSTLFATITAEAARESEVWAAALVPGDGRQPVGVFSELVPDHLKLGLETVYEAYLVHYGRPRLFVSPDPDDAILLGDYLYAHGLVRIAEAGGVPAVAAMAELIARCAALRADGAAGDGEAWIDAVRALGGTPDDEAVARALERHSDRVRP
ncbi:MAG TPA: hypothetical protein VFB25_00440 [Gaiellaceae bacterium]|nr:hypothetical protein [Gaiellaceae bacterium]